MPPSQQCEGAVKTHYMQRGEMKERNQQNKEKKVKLLIIMYYKTKIFKKICFS